MSFELDLRPCDALVGYVLILWCLTASAIAGFFASFFSLPFDFVKTRLQKQTKGPDGQLQYKGMADCFAKVAREEGLLRFYRGYV